MEAVGDAKRGQIKAAQAKLNEVEWCTIPAVLTTKKSKEDLEHLWEAVEESERQGEKTNKDFFDPNASNVRVFYLRTLDSMFLDLVQHPTALEIVKGIFGQNFLISNFTANIAQPGSGSMGLHSDQSLMCPDPWLTPWNLNIIWCLTDVYFENGATLHIPGSHRWKTRADIPEEPEKLLVPFKAKAGSIIAMDGRV